MTLLRARRPARLLFTNPVQTARRVIRISDSRTGFSVGINAVKPVWFSTFICHHWWHLVFGFFPFLWANCLRIENVVCFADTNLCFLAFQQLWWQSYQSFQSLAGFSCSDVTCLLPFVVIDDSQLDILGFGTSWVIVHKCTGAKNLVSSVKTTLLGMENKNLSVVTCTFCITFRYFTESGPITDF